MINPQYTFSIKNTRIIYMHYAQVKNFIYKCVRVKRHSFYSMIGFRGKYLPMNLCIIQWNTQCFPMYNFTTPTKANANPFHTGSFIIVQNEWYFSHHVTSPMFSFFLHFSYFVQKKYMRKKGKSALSSRLF